MGIKKEIVYKKLEELKPYERNPRKNKEAVKYVKSSIEEFHFQNPIIIKEDGEIICGHTRYFASKELNLEEVPCIIADDLTDEQVKAFRLADNKISEMAEWDYDLLDEELDDILNINMEDFGFLDLDDEEEKEAEEDDFDVEPPEEPKAKYGDIYKLGEHRLMCGDSTKEEDVALLMDGNKADMVFTDPPYGMNLNTDYSSMKSEIFKGKTGGKGYSQVIGDNDDFTPDLINTIFKNFDYCNEIFLWGADYYAELLINKNNGSWIVWDKRLDDSADKMYGSCFELCWSKNKHKRDIARIKWAGIFGMEKDDTTKRVHPTQKPLLLCNWFLEKYSNKNEIVVDLYGGSGSTLIACEQLNRKCYMMELDPKYIDVIIERWEKFTGKKAVKIN